MHSIPTKCPVCEGNLSVRRMACERCEVAIEGRFALGALGKLSKEQLGFVEIFLLARGKIKEVEAQLGISYPTVVARLEEVVAAISTVSRPDAGKPAEPPASVDDVLDALSRGDLTASEAASRLKKRKDKR